MIKRLAHVNPLQCGKVLAALYLGLSLVFIPFALLVMVIGSTQSSHGGPNPMAVMAGMGLFFIIAVPILYTILGFVFGVIGALIYNLVAKLTGGLEVTFVDAPSQAGTPYPTPLPPLQ